MADKPIEEQASWLDDLEQPNVDGPSPRLVTDFVRDSTPAPGAGLEELTPHGLGVVERDAGWTSTAEDSREPDIYRHDEA